MVRAAPAVCLLVLIVAAGCSRQARPPLSGDATLRIAISAGRMSLSAPDVGLVQIRQNLALESLASFDDAGTPRPAVAERWTVSDDRRRVTVRLRDNLQYQDGTIVTPADIVSILKRTLPRSMGPAYEDLEDIRASGLRDVELQFHRPSGFRLELLEVPVQKPGAAAIGTGPYTAVRDSRNEMVANDHYYLGKPLISRIRIDSYPTFRSAWADMLRGRNDMLYEVGVDALDSLQNARNVARVFTFPRRYQYVIVLNTSAPALVPAAVRVALNLGIDRQALVRDALSGHAEPSIGPVSSRQWAIAGRNIPTLATDTVKAASLLGKRDRPLRFTCLVLADHERLALVVKRQLQQIGVDLALEQVTTDTLLTRVAAHDYDAFLVDAISGPTMYRLYRWWHSRGTFNAAGVHIDAIDQALDEIRYAASDDQYRAGVIDFQRAALSDPPAIFLAWSEGARAVSPRFEVGTDVHTDPMTTLRSWRPANADAFASRN